MYTYSNTQIDPRLYNVKTITSLDEITDISDNILNSSYGIFSYDDEKKSRYISHKVKMSTITDEALKKVMPWIDKLKNEFSYFIENLWISYEPTYMNVTKSEKRFVGPGGQYTYLSYNFHISPLFSYLETDYDNYVVSYIPGSDNEYTYLYSYEITPGLINHVVLQDYVNNTIDRLLGAPNTPEDLDAAINSIQEFVNWFKGYAIDNPDYGSLEYLINKIESNDEHILQLSYDYTDKKCEETLDLSYAYTLLNRELAYDYANTHSGGGGGGANYNAGNNISIDNNTINCYIGIDSNINKLSISGTQYSLTIDENGKLGFTQYTPINLTNITSAQHFEHDSGSHTITLSAKPTKNCVVTNKWENDEAGLSYTAESTISTSVIVSNNTESRFDLTVKELDNNATKTAEVNIKYDMFVPYATLYSENDNETVTSFNHKFESAEWPNWNIKDATITSSSHIEGTHPDNNRMMYFYFLIPNGQYDAEYIRNHFFRNGSAIGGGFVYRNQCTVYSNNKKYYLYRTSDKYNTSIYVDIK